MIMDLKKNAWYRCNEMMRSMPAEYFGVPGCARVWLPAEVAVPFPFRAVG